MKKFIYSLSVFILLVFPALILSQTITTSAISPLEYCANTDLTVSYTADNGFATDNVFIAQLSDSNGSFNTFINIGHLKSSVSGNIIATIPSIQKDGSKYRIRIISSNPYIVGTDNGADIVVNSIPSDRLKISNEKKYNKILEDVNLRLDYGDGSKGRITNPARWDFGTDAIPASYIGYNPPPVIFNTIGKRKVFFEVTPLSNCSYKQKDSSYVDVIGCEVAIDSNNVITYDSANHTLPIPKGLNNVHQVWILPNGSVTTNTSIGKEIYIIETGGNLQINGSAYNTLFYLKPGASLTVKNSRFDYCGIVKSPGSSVNLPDSTSYDYETLTIVDCSSLKFNYSTAPQQGKEILAALGFSDIKEYQDQNINLNIFPNPVTDILHISGDYSGEQVRIYSPEGFKVYEAAFTNEIDLSKLPVGIYFMRVRDKIAKFSKF